MSNGRRKIILWSCKPKPRDTHVWQKVQNITGSVHNLFCITNILHSIIEAHWTKPYNQKWITMPSKYLLFPPSKHRHLFIQPNISLNDYKNVLNFYLSHFFSKKSTQRPKYANQTYYSVFQLIFASHLCLEDKNTHYRTGFYCCFFLVWGERRNK